MIEHRFNHTTDSANNADLRSYRRAWEEGKISNFGIDGVNDVKLDFLVSLWTFVCQGIDLCKILSQLFRVHWVRIDIEPFNAIFQS